MKKNLPILAAILLTVAHLQAQVEPAARNWKTWFITSCKDYRLPAPSSYREEIAQVLSRQQNLDSAACQQVMYWNAGAPGYRWQDIMSGLLITDTSSSG